MTWTAWPILGASSRAKGVKAPRWLGTSPEAHLSSFALRALTCVHATWCASLQLWHRRAAAVSAFTRRQHSFDPVRVLLVVWPSNRISGLAAAPSDSGVVARTGANVTGITINPHQVSVRNTAASISWPLTHHVRSLRRPLAGEPRPSDHEPDDTVLPAAEPLHGAGLLKRAGPGAQQL